MKYLNYIFFFMTLCCCSTDGNQLHFGREVKLFSMEDFNAITVESEKHYFDSLIRPGHIGLTKDYIVVSDRATPTHLHLIQKSDMNYLGGFGQRGDGPQEFLSFSGFKRSPSKEQLTIYSTNDKKIIWYNLPSGLSADQINDIQPDSVYRLSDINTESTYFNYLDDSTLISKERTTANKFIVISGTSGEVVQNFDTWDGMLERADVPYSVVASVFQSDIAVDASGTYFGHAPVLWDLIEVKNLLTGKWLRLLGPDKLEHQFEIDASPGYPMHLWNPEENSIGYISLSLGAEYIFALYSGMEAVGAHGTKVLVFDYNGTPLNAFQLDIPATRMAVDEEKTTIYLIYNQGDTVGIASFDYELP